MTEAFPWDTAPCFPLRDRNASYGQTFRDRVQAMGIEEVGTAHDPRGTERLCGAHHRLDPPRMCECLNHITIFDEQLASSVIIRKWDAESRLV